jgi:hypothetical protein
MTINYNYALSISKREYSTLKTTEVTMGGDWKVVNKSGRDESIWVVVHLCTEAMIGISLYSYLNYKLGKVLCLSYYFLCLLFNKIRKAGRTYYAWKQWGCGVRGRVWGTEGKNGTDNVCTYE